MSRLTKLLAVFTLFLATTVVLAASPHFVVGPTFALNANNTVTSTGSIAGLGNANIDVVLTAILDVQVLCRNHGGNIAPGQIQRTTATGRQNAIHPENGRANFSVTTAAPVLVGTAKQLGCPNDGWTTSIGTIAVISATLQVYQGGVVVLSASFTP
jgi:hypothetical protein